MTSVIGEEFNKADARGKILDPNLFAGERICVYPCVECALCTAKETDSGNRLFRFA